MAETHITLANEAEGAAEREEGYDPLPCQNSRPTSGVQSPLQAKERLDAYFSTRPASLAKIFDEKLEDIAHLLRVQESPSAAVPRLYFLLRTIGHLEALDDFIQIGATDLWFPFAFGSLPQRIHKDVPSSFLRAQWVVLTRCIDLEKGAAGAHQHLDTGDTLPFQHLELLGSGAYGVVDRVRSTITGRVYARKRIRRNIKQTMRRNMETFEKEVSAMKRMKHQHVVELVGSYTDPVYAAFIISPVADCNLEQFIASIAVDDSGLSKFPLLRTFFGCLANGLTYMHSQSVRHKDVKPMNILVKDSTVLYTDFGLALDWTGAGNSTTEDTSPVMTRMYSAPEVLKDGPRNSSTDVWSLGCVFLEMTASLNRCPVSKIKEYLLEYGTKSTVYARNIDGVLAFIDGLRGEDDRSVENQCCHWVKWMLKPTPNQRPTAKKLFQAIQNAGEFVGPCCRGLQDTGEKAHPNHLEQDEPNQDFSSKSLKRMEGSNSSSTIIPPVKPLLRHQSKSMQRIQTLLARAILTQNVPQAEETLETGADIHFRYTNGDTTLMKAAEVGNTAMAAMMLEKGATLDTQNNKGMNALHVAAAAGREEMATMLIERGIDVNSIDDSGMSPLHCAVSSKELQCAIRLVNLGAEIDAADKDGYTPLRYAVTEGAANVVRYLLSRGADPNRRYGSNETTLALDSAANGRLEILRTLISYGADVEDTRDVFGLTPLMGAAACGHIDCTRTLLDQGAHVDAHDNQGRTALHHACYSKKPASVRILLEHGALLDGGNTARMPPWCLAAIADSTECLEILLAYGFDMNSPSGWGINGGSALTFAALEGNVKTARYLIEQGIDLDHRNKRGETALHCAAAKGHLETVSVLLDNGADREAMTQGGSTALDLAVAAGHVEVVRLLE